MSDVLLFILVAGGLIFAHEVGHFVAARLRGIAVDEFGIGFPPRLARLFEHQGTLYSLNLIPFGGFVRLAGEDDPSVPGGMASAQKRTRLIVLLAGPAMNLLLGFLAFTAAFRYAAPDPTRVLITGVQSDTPAEAAGIRSGDIFLMVDDVAIDSFDSLHAAIASRRGVATTLTLQRGEETITLNLIPRTEFPEGEGPVGVLLGYPTRVVPLAEAVVLGADATAFQVVQTLRLPFLLFQGDIEPEQARVSGLKGIYDMLTWATDIDQATRRPFITLQVIGVIGVGLAIANLLPIPALDGGRLLFLAIEVVFKRRIAPRTEGLAHAIGFAVMLVLLMYITIQDFVNPIVLPR